MRQKKHGLKVKKFSLLPTGELQKVNLNVIFTLSGIIRRFIFALECFLNLMSYLTQPGIQKDRIKSNFYYYLIHDVNC